MEYKDVINNIQIFLEIDINICNKINVLCCECLMGLSYSQFTRSSMW